tara:strand:- start:102 stop:446 length:345 start_codon:yes stop_codon:yes gene_type:complete
LSLNKYNLIEEFFWSHEQMVKFFVRLKVMGVHNEEGTCFAKLEKKDDFWVYTTGLYNGKFVGENIKPHRPSLENYELFNRGCKEMARLLEIYIDTDDKNAIPINEKPFGKLTFD